MTSDEAIARARAELREDAGVAVARHVVRPEGRPPYWLVSIETDERTLGVAAIGDDGELVGAGRLAGGPGRLPAIDVAQARELAAAPPDAPGRLVWFASRASQSPIFPLWELVRDGAPVWVGMDGAVYTERPGPGLGG